MTEVILELNWAVVTHRSLKNPGGFNGIRTNDPCDAGVLANLDPLDLNPPGINLLADLDPTVQIQIQIWSRYKFGPPGD